ncbi:MICOS complex subunit MIC60 [Asticcacaulis sp. AND118]|uniref:MICOS complex subunit MIC60 n=1 Tax=Asticcacaulis sp. AND118 TaxID=2840468 RepID=UPI001CFF703C|nr:MICOS complex subunit MIC60 [Asticcacaulis sp. AND118]UDF04969.1 MICOS complex subunit MIC60 [Asticcacaulis sp. AND118]
MTQTSENTYKIPSPTDSRIASFFEAIIEFSKLDILAVAKSGNVTLVNFKNLTDVLEKYSTNIESTRIFNPIHLSGIPGLEVYFHRRTTKFSNGNIHESSFAEAEIYLYAHQNTGQTVDQNLFKYIISKINELFLSSVMDDAGSYDKFKSIYAEHISRLSEIHENFIKSANEQSRKREDEYHLRIATLEAENQEKLKEIQEVEKKSLNNIEIERANLNKKIKELDNSSHMHARRDMRLKITESLRDRLAKSAVSRTVGAHRWTVLAICGFLASVFSLSAAFSAYELSIVMEKTNEATIPFYVTSLRLALAVGAIAVVGFYALGFMRKVHDSDLKSERDLERYLYDVDRSSWVIETVLEAKSKENGQDPAEIPTHWLDGVTHGLFKQSDEVQDNDKAVEVLASLFKFSARAKLGPAGPEFEMNNSGARKFSKENLEDS